MPREESSTENKDGFRIELATKPYLTLLLGLGSLLVIGGLFVSKHSVFGLFMMVAGLAIQCFGIEYSKKKNKLHPTKTVRKTVVKASSTVAIRAKTANQIVDLTCTKHPRIPKCDRNSSNQILAKLNVGEFAMKSASASMVLLLSLVFINSSVHGQSPSGRVEAEWVETQFCNTECEISISGVYGFDIGGIVTMETGGISTTNVVFYAFNVSVEQRLTLVTETVVGQTSFATIVEVELPGFEGGFINDENNAISFIEEIVIENAILMHGILEGAKTKSVVN